MLFRLQALTVLAVLGATGTALAQELLPRGQVIVHLPCERAPSLGYAIYFPSSYTPDKAWPVLLGFHYEGNGRAIVETYRAAAERYGYIVAASNDSRNGDWNTSTNVAQVMADDVMGRFSVDPTRVYLTGLSGGSRLALQIALSNKAIAGVIASSAGYLDLQPRSTLRFPVFATVGRFDFNYVEMRRMANALTSPRQIAVFDGGHVLPPPDVAMRAVGWMELRAMASRLRPRDEAVIDELWARALAAIESAGESAAAVHLLRAAANDFRGLRDVAPLEIRSSDLAKLKPVRNALDVERRNEQAEMDLVDAIVAAEVSLADPAARNDSLSALQSIVSDLRRRAGALTPSADREVAQRVLNLITYAPLNRVRDQDYLALLLGPPPRR